MPEESNYERVVYTIPVNTVSTGKTVFNGNLKMRNCLESAVFFPVSLLIWFLLTGFFPVAVKIAVFCFFNLPVLILSLTGIKGKSLGAAGLDFLDFRRKRRVLLFRIPQPPEEKRRTGAGKFGRRKREKEEYEELF